MKRLIMFLLLAGAAFSGVQAQFLIVGKILSSNEKKPISEATVRLVRQESRQEMRSAKCDENGCFQLKNDTMPTLLSISAEGFDVTEVSVPATYWDGPTGLGKIEMGEIVLVEKKAKPCRFWCSIKKWFKKK